MGLEPCWYEVGGMLNEYTGIGDKLGGKVFDLMHDKELQGSLYKKLHSDLGINKDIYGILRSGAKSVLQFELMPKPPESKNEQTPWPNWPMILRTFYHLLYSN